jgi:hypothetical protein
MKKVVVFLVGVICFHFSTKSQPVIDKVANIVNSNKLIDNIRITGGTKFRLDSTVSSNVTEGGFDVINNKGEIWLTQNGSNKVYKLGGDGKAIRLDRTINRGYNFGAINLFYKDTLYSIGGYGFWQTTGSIRYFNPNSGEWDIVRNIKNVPIASGINAICHYDKLQGKLFVIYTPTRPEYEKYDENTDEEVLMQCFDFREKSWWDIAKQINPKIAKKITDLSIIQNYGQTVLISSKVNGKVMSVNFNSNKIYEVDYKYHTELKQLLNSRNNYIAYTIDEKLYINDLDANTILYSTIKENQISSYQEAFYINETNKLASSRIPWLSISIIVNIALGISIFVIVHLQKKRKELLLKLGSDNNRQQKEIKSTKEYLQYLSNIEIDLLKLLLKNNLNNEKTSISQINKILGTEKKEIKIQNNIRGEAIISINNKFMSFALVKDSLIERQRVEFDKRHMEYFINEKYVNRFSLKMF